MPLNTLLFMSIDMVDGKRRSICICYLRTWRSALEKIQPAAVANQISRKPRIPPAHGYLRVILAFALKNM